MDIFEMQLEKKFLKKNDNRKNKSFVTYFVVLCETNLLK